MREIDWEELERLRPTSTVLWDHQSIPPTGTFRFILFESGSVRAQNKECLRGDFCDCRTWSPIDQKWVPMFQIRKESGDYVHSAPDGTLRSRFLISSKSDTGTTPGNSSVA